MAISSFNPKTQTYTSTRPPIKLPTSPDLSLTSFIFQSTSAIPRRTALLDSNSNETLTFLQLKAHVSSLAYALRHQFHVAKHDVVLIFAPNSIRFAISFLAIVSLGAIATTANPSFTFTEISKQVKDSNPKLIITIPQLYSKVSQFNVPLLPQSAIPKFSYYSDIIQNYADQHLNSNDVKQTDLAALLYSSGTTGTNKGVMLTHKNFIASTLSFTAGQDRSVCLCFLPMFHGFGSVLTLAQLRRGNVLVSMAKFGLDKVLGAIEKYKVTHMFVVPPVMVSLAKQWQMMNNKYDLSSLKQIISSAAPLSRDLIETCAHILPHVQIFQAYGMTEACGNISMENPKEGPPFSGSTGTLMPLIQSKIISVTTMNPLPPNQMGEICIRGPTITLGYFNNPEATKVAPAELEGLLLSHPDIVDAVVIPFPDIKAGEVPIAYVVRASNSSLTEKDVQLFVKISNYLARLVAHYKRLRSVTFLKSIPRLTSEKILKRTHYKN
ncbi:4-coumarate--CoA ligase-like 7 isoform X1 [Gossypium australe]|uniref:4-coumarate--CoA ligase-like 7 isoform X1 n=1 Tax=Gossypium australe TaxID=47621 RepID=A0A5B6UAY0_9ROSI|nr:4-coumarate--CoA ligase-like 7 isoform X1 [Gossypium australe]